jgi:peptidoglycan-N-acetylglucosamine deacetylase
MKKIEKRSFLSTSWDDGHPLDLRIAELLTKHGLTGTFYVPRSSQTPVMNSGQIQELSRAFEIGAHTLDHVRIDRAPDAEARRQIFGARQWVEQITGQGCEVFCFPQGKFKARHLRFVRDAGFRAARTVELLSIAEPRSADGLQMIPTTVQAFPHRFSVYAKNAAKRLAATPFLNLAPAASSKNWVALAKKMLCRVIERGGVFHLWGHSWEIEEQQQWEELEELMQAMSLCRERCTVVTNAELCEYAA